MTAADSGLTLTAQLGARKAFEESLWYLACDAHLTALALGYAEPYEAVKHAHFESAYARVLVEWGWGTLREVRDEITRRAERIERERVAP